MMRRYSERNYDRGYDRDFDPSYDFAGDAHGPYQRFRPGRAFSSRTDFDDVDDRRRFAAPGGSYRTGYHYDRGYLDDYDLRDYERGEFDRGGYAHRPKLRRGYRTVGGPHRGRGPRGYRRSRERITEDVCDALTWHSDLDASDIEVDVDDSEVTLRGTVESRWAKRLADDLAESVIGVRDVHNRLTIRRDADDEHEGRNGASA